VENVEGSQVEAKGVEQKRQLAGRDAPSFNRKWATGAPQEQFMQIPAISKNIDAGDVREESLCNMHAGSVLHQAL
jgi:hypothetical protein